MSNDVKISELDVRAWTELSGQEALPFADDEGNGAVTVEGLSEYASEGVNRRFEELSESVGDAVDQRLADIDGHMSWVQGLVAKADISEMDSLMADCVLGRYVVITSNGIGQGHLMGVRCSAGRVLQQTFVTYLPLDENGQITLTHADNGEMHIYTRLYNLSDPVTVEATGEVVGRNQWSRWHDIAGSGVKEIGERVDAVELGVEALRSSKADVSALGSLANQTQSALAGKVDKTSIVVLSESEYEALGDGVDGDKLYFITEDEE